MPIHDPLFNNFSYLLAEDTPPTGFESDEYKTLNDAAKLHPELSPGSTEIWFMKPSHFTQFITGLDTPTIKALPQTHVLLGKVRETKPEKLYRILQGDSWSPNGEANALILAKGLHHTSISIGDVLKIGGKHYVVGSYGFKELNEDVDEAVLEPGSKAKVLKSLKLKDRDSGEWELVDKGEIVTIDFKDGNGYVVSKPGMNSVKIPTSALQPIGEQTMPSSMTDRVRPSRKGDEPASAADIQRRADQDGPDDLFALANDAEDEEEHEIEMRHGLGDEIKTLAKELVWAKEPTKPEIDMRRRGDYGRR